MSIAVLRVQALGLDTAEPVPLGEELAHRLLGLFETLGRNADDVPLVPAHPLDVLLDREDPVARVQPEAEHLAGNHGLPVLHEEDALHVRDVRGETNTLHLDAAGVQAWDDPLAQGQAVSCGDDGLELMGVAFVEHRPDQLGQIDRCFQLLLLSSFRVH